MTPVLKKIIVKNRLTKLYCVWSNMVTVNETHATFLVCAADDFQKKSENAEIEILFTKNHKDWS